MHVRPFLSTNSLISAFYTSILPDCAGPVSVEGLSAPACPSNFVSSVWQSRNVILATGLLLLMVELCFYCFCSFFFLLSLCLSLSFSFCSFLLLLFLNPSAPFLSPSLFCSSWHQCACCSNVNFTDSFGWVDEKQTKRNKGLELFLKKTRHLATEVKIVRRWNQSVREQVISCVDQPGGFRSVPSTGLSNLLQNVNSLKELGLCSRSTDLHPLPPSEQLCQAAVCTPKEPWAVISFPFYKKRKLIWEPRVKFSNEVCTARFHIIPAVQR